MADNIYDLIIIGAGPGGITAGIYAARQRLKTLLITKDFGGQIAKKAVDICNYPGYPRIKGAELIEKFVQQLKCEEVEIVFNEAGKIEKKGEKFILTTSDKKQFSGISVIIASGADPRPLEAKGEKEFIGRGLSYCVTCDGPLFKNKDIAVIGGGNAGFEAAVFMTNYAKKIYILEYGQSPKADQENQGNAKRYKNIELITSAKVTEIKGDKLVSAVLYEDLAAKKIKTLDVQGVFVEIGSQPATSMAKGLVDFNERDEIKVEFETFQTKTPGLYAVGDVNVGRFKQIITAAGEGCKAALAAYDYVYKLKNKDA